MWIDYPGPVFSSWEDARSYIRAVNASQLDELQLKIMRWYFEFKNYYKSRVTMLVRSVFGIPVPPPPPIVESSGSPAIELSLTQPGLTEATLNEPLVNIFNLFQL